MPTSSRSIWPLWPALAGAWVLAACGPEDAPPLPGQPDPGGRHLPPSGRDASAVAPSCTTPNEGCACAAEGEAVDCGHVERRSGDYVSCSMGQRTCTQGYWGACVGDRIASRLASFRPSYRTLALGPVVPCDANPCDPFCQIFVDDTTGIDAGASLVPGDGGFTLVIGQQEPGASTCTGLAVAPTPQTITVTALSPLATTPPALQFDVTLTPTGCASTALVAAWSNSHSDISQVTPGGSFGVYEPVAASAQLTAYVGSWQASAVADIVVDVADTTQAPPGTAVLFDGVASGPDAFTILYPYAGTVLPVGLKAPEIHWESATAADAVKVSLRYPATGVPTFEWSTIIPESAPPRATIDQAAWEGFDRSARGQDAALVLQRVVAGTLRTEQVRAIHFAPASLRGHIYYTEYGRAASSPMPAPAVGGDCSFAIGSGVIRSLDPAGTTLATDPFNGTGGCPVCHSVSANGTTFVTSDWGNANGVSRINADGTFTPVATSPQPPSPGVDSRGFSYAAITPDGQYVLQGSNLWGNTSTGGIATGQRLSAGNGTGLRGEYFDNITLAGTAESRQVDQTVQFDWAAGTPYPFLGADAFSVRWEGKVQPYATEAFTFDVVVDGGVRLWVNGTQLIDQWSEQTATHSGTINLTAGTKYDIVLEYFESAGNAAAELRWSSPTTVAEVIPQTQLYAAPLGASTNGLTAEYYDNIDLTGTLVTRVDLNIDFDWGGGAPMPSMDAETFSVRWTGSIQPLYTETYTFHASTDDGVRVWVNGSLVVDNWVDQGSPGACPVGVPFAGSIALTGGTTYPIRVEFRENGGAASSRLYWSSASTACAIIPQSRLFQ